MSGVKVKDCVYKNYSLSKMKEDGIISNKRNYNSNDSKNLEFLINSDEDYNNFKSIFKKNEKTNLTYVLTKYKEFLRGDMTIYVNRVKSKITELDSLLKRKWYNNLRLEFEEIFLEPLSDEDMMFFIKRSIGNKVNIKRLIDYHLKYMDRSFKSVVAFAK